MRRGSIAVVGWFFWLPPVQREDHRETPDPGEIAELAGSYSAYDAIQLL